MKRPIFRAFHSDEVNFFILSRKFRICLTNAQDYAIPSLYFSDKDITLNALCPFLPARYELKTVPPPERVIDKVMCGMKICSKLVVHCKT